MLKQIWVCLSFILSSAAATHAWARPSNLNLSVDGTVDYLALGDSIPFGDNSFIPYTAEARPDLRAFVGYADYVGTWAFAGHYRNLACPGESSGSFLDLTQPSMGCQAFKEELPLKTAYEGSQMDAALDLIALNPQMKLITISLGGNDYLLVKQNCEIKFPDDEKQQKDCILRDVFPAIGRASQNIGTIIKSIRQAGFRGKILMTNSYSLDYADPVITTSAVVGNIVFGVTSLLEKGGVVDFFGAFGWRSAPLKGDLCSTGLLIKNPKVPVPAGENRCDYHPTAEGAELLAKLVINEYRKW